MITIRPVSHNEIYEIAAFLDESWRVEYRKIIADKYLDTMSVEERYKMLLSRFDERSSDCLVMRNNNNLIGVVAFGESHTDDYLEDGEIAAIYLHHDYLGTGHGHALLIKAEEALGEKGYTHIVLNVLSENTRAVLFYQKHGYRNVDDRSTVLGEGDYPLKVFRKKNETYREG